MKIFDRTFDGLEKALDLRFKRHALLTSNVANADTPNYKARELDFSGQLEAALGQKNENALKMTDNKHMDVASFQHEHIVFDNSGALGSDGNNVDLDVMMGKVSANGRDYEGAATLFSKKLSLLRTLTRRGSV
jgi:flagellar basal-body rod protein FlgB